MTLRLDAGTEDGLQIDRVGQANLQRIVAAALFKPNLGKRAFTAVKATNRLTA